jgi:lysozyme family protein
LTPIAFGKNPAKYSAGFFIYIRILKPAIMALLKQFVDKILHWEGNGFFVLKDDKGGPTKMGITLSTWKSIGYDKDKDGDIDVEDLKLIDSKDYELVVVKFWNRWIADNIKNQSIAEILVDWVWTSGSWGIIIPQRLLGVKQDGVVGPKTIAALNAQVPSAFFARVKKARQDFYDDIVKKNPKQRKWIRGWTRRNNSFVFRS